MVDVSLCHRSWAKSVVLTQMNLNSHANDLLENNNKGKLSQNVRPGSSYVQTSLNPSVYQSTKNNILLIFNWSKGSTSTCFIPYQFVSVIFLDHNLRR